MKLISPVKLTQPSCLALQARALKPTSATAGTLMLGTNVLHGIDQAVQDVVDAVMAAQEAAAGGPGGLIRLSKAAQPVLQLDQAVSMAGRRVKAVRRIHQ
jgi:hypothetical protein